MLTGTTEHVSSSLSNPTPPIHWHFTRTDEIESALAESAGPNSCGVGWDGAVNNAGLQLRILYRHLCCADPCQRAQVDARAPCHPSPCTDANRSRATPCMSERSHFIPSQGATPLTRISSALNEHATSPVDSVIFSLSAPSTTAWIRMMKEENATEMA